MKSTIIAVIIGASLVSGAVLLSQKTTKQPETTPIASNVTQTDDTQIVAIKAKGGYSPKLSTAKADTKTILKMETDSTFDCTSIINIPALNYQKNLPPTGVTEIDIPPQKAGTTLEGLCGMGMFRFEIAFQ